MGALVFQSDFGLDDGAVSAMHGVAYGIDSSLNIFDLTHGIEPYNILEASFRLMQTINYWPEGTTFVSVVDPGVGSDRRSIVVKTNSNKYVVTPDNGTLTLVNNMIGIKEARIINETINRRPDSSESYTFHGRDIYAYTGARLASGVINFEEVGDEIDVNSLVLLDIKKPVLKDNSIEGFVETLDIRYGSLWTNIDYDLFSKLNIGLGQELEVLITSQNRVIYRNRVVFARSFADVNEGEALVYVNSLKCIAIAINKGSFANAYNIGTGPDWQISLSKIEK